MLPLINDHKGNSLNLQAINMTFLLAKVVPLSSSSLRIFLCRQFSTPFQQFGQRHLLSQSQSQLVPSVTIQQLESLGDILERIHQLKRLGAQVDHLKECLTEALLKARHEEQDKDYKIIERSLWPGYFKNNAPWGFVLY